MNDKIFSFIVIALVLGAAAISSLDSFYTLKSVYYNIAMIALVALAFERFYKHRKKKKQFNG
ncbi:hypothetical protein [Peribacillus loiseleuriae]|uniref:Uncharacterized protein n=1 Tax=Peribacillus loiseleuriae TaxID=1679170 RepID=A0A0K9GQ67_9BACI|nr:hypothetical protein [Peribacillus loiseleuriae]KMY48800.1 hypothetical protein AC625_04125 [Peribacillus loiseleuriae]